MKELSIEEKAKRYDEAIKFAKIYHNQGDEDMKTMCETMFSELKECEDERIRKEMIETIKKEAQDFPSSIIAEKSNSWLSWLEKQGEQSIKWHKNTEGNKPQKNHSVLIKTTHGIAEGEWNGGNHWIQYRWSGSIKDSDVLFWIELSDIEKQGEQRSDDIENKFIRMCETKPANIAEFLDRLTTVEQEFLWEHIAKIRELDKEEQKPTDKVEPKFKVGQTIKKEGFNLEFIIVKIEDGFYYNDMGDYFPFTDQDNWELVEQKTAWSEEDERLYKKVKTAINSYYAPFSRDAEEMSEWFKNLKDRVIPQPVWSKEDDETLCRCISATFDHGYLKECDWLKSFRPQNRWKPSDEHYELEEFAKIVRGNLTGISKAVQELFKAKYLQLTGRKMYGGFKD